MTALDRLLAECDPGLWDTAGERVRAHKLARIVRVLVAARLADNAAESHDDENDDTLAEVERIAGEG